MQDGRTPLFVASYTGRPEVVQVLLAAGANKDVKDKVRTAVLPVQPHGSENCGWTIAKLRSGRAEYSFRTEVHFEQGF